jgi:hypothetical protein
MRTEELSSLESLYFFSFGQPSKLEVFGILNLSCCAPFIINKKIVGKIEGMHRKSHEKKIVSKGVEMNDLVNFGYILEIKVEENQNPSIFLANYWNL